MCINNALNNKHIQGQQCECPQLQNNSLSRLETMNYFEIHNIIIINMCLTNHNNNKNKKNYYFYKSKS